MHSLDNREAREILTTAISLTNSARCCSKTVGLEDLFLGIGVVDIVDGCMGACSLGSGLGGRFQ